MAGVCDTWLSWVRTWYLCVLKFGYIVTNPAVIMQRQISNQHVLLIQARPKMIIPLVSHMESVCVCVEGGQI